MIIAVKVALALCIYRYKLRAGFIGCSCVELARTFISVPVWNLQEPSSLFLCGTCKNLYHCSCVEPVNQASLVWWKQNSIKVVILCGTCDTQQLYIRYQAKVNSRQSSVYMYIQYEQPSVSMKCRSCINIIPVLQYCSCLWSASAWLAELLLNVKECVENREPIRGK